MKRSLTQKRFAALIIAACLAVAVTAVLLSTKHSPAPDAAGKTQAPVTTVLPATVAADEPAPKMLTKEEASVALPSVSVRGEVITAHLATVPESVWHQSAPAQPPYAVPAPSYPPFPNDPPTPGVPIINSPLRPADAARTENSEK